METSIYHSEHREESQFAAQHDIFRNNFLNYPPNLGHKDNDFFSICRIFGR